MSAPPSIVEFPEFNGDAGTSRRELLRSGHAWPYVDGEGIPVGIHVTSARPAEVTLVHYTLNTIRVPRPQGG